MSHEEKLNRLVQALTQTFSSYDDVKKITLNLPVLTDAQRTNIVSNILTVINDETISIDISRRLDILVSLITASIYKLDDNGNGYHESVLSKTSRSAVTLKYYTLLASI